MNRFIPAALILLISIATLQAAPETAKATTLKAPINATPATIKGYFNSPEYLSLKKSDAEFLTDVYRVVLNREPDAEGRKIWLAALKNGAKDPKAREKAVEAFFQSPEYIGRA